MHPGKDAERKETWRGRTGGECKGMGGDAVGVRPTVPALCTGVGC